MVRILNAENLVPPYVSYASWLRLLDALSRSLPEAVDETYLASLEVGESGVKALRSALRFLGLVGNDELPAERLRRLVNGLQSDHGRRQEALREVIFQAYRPLFSRGLDLESMTVSQLRLHFGSLGARGQIQQKCSSFFLNLARDAGMQLPAHLTRRARASVSPRLSRRDSYQSKDEEDSVLASLAGRRQTPMAATRELGFLPAMFPKFDI